MEDNKELEEKNNNQLQQSNTQQNADAKQDNSQDKVLDTKEIVEKINTILKDKNISNEDVKKRYSDITMRAKDANINKAFELVVFGFSKFEEMLSAVNKEFTKNMENVPIHLKVWADFVSKNDKEKSLAINAETAQRLKTIRDGLHKAKELFTQGKKEEGNKIVDDLIADNKDIAELLQKYKQN